MRYISVNLAAKIYLYESTSADLRELVSLKNYKDNVRSCSMKQLLRRIKTRTCPGDRKILQN